MSLAMSLAITLCVDIVHAESAPAAPPGQPEVAPPAAPAEAPPAPVAAPAPETDAPPAAVAKDTLSQENPYFPVDTTRRYGFKLAATGSLQLTKASGSPIKFDQRDRAVDTGLAAGTGFSVLLGGVFTDWFSFHLGVSWGTAQKGDFKIPATTFVLGIETWPLFKLGGVFRDIGVGGDFGTGAASVARKSTGEDVATGSGFSMIRGTVFWDALSLGNINVGPYLAFENRTAETYSQQVFWVGLRSALYGVSR